MRINTLDPRNAATGATTANGCLDGFLPVIDKAPDSVEYGSGCDGRTENYPETYDSDLRDPSRYFMVFETGDNNTV